MGLCKCPKKKVTNLFCFEHRVNVCENCLVENHGKCVVQSYLQWLQDSDYNPNCSLCDHSLQEEDCIRLSCYDVFHWRCLNARLQKLPSNTAPAGYECPLCSRSVIPTENAAGPVVDGIRAHLHSAAWAQTALGCVAGSNGLGSALAAAGAAPKSPQQQSVVSRLPIDSVEMTSERGAPSESMAAKGRGVGPPSAVKVRMAPSPMATGSGRFASQHHPGVHRDVDENKYARRPAFTWLAWVLRSSGGEGVRGGAGAAKRPPLSPRKRLLLLGFLVFLAASTLLYLMSTLGRQAADSDPMLQPEFNPNIRVQQHPAAVVVGGGVAAGSGPEMI